MKLNVGTTTFVPFSNLLIWLSNSFISTAVIDSKSGFPSSPSGVSLFHESNHLMINESGLVLGSLNIMIIS